MVSLPSFRLAIAMALLLLCASLSSAHATEPPNEVWITATGGDGPGAGTVADPFDGSSAQKFDALFQWFQGSPDLTIHLGPGTFESNVTASVLWTVGTGWVVEGAGLYETTCKMVGNLKGRHWDHEFFKSPFERSTDRVTIRNLTVDCNWPGLSATADMGAKAEKYGAIYAIDLRGSDILIENVRHINSRGSWANGNEAFGIRLSAPSSNDVSGNIIQNCRAELPQGNYGAPFALHGWVDSKQTRFISNSLVSGNVAIGQESKEMSGFSTGGVNGAFIKDCQVSDNSFVDCQSVFYQDTGSVDGLIVSGNTLTRGWMGVGLVADNPAWTKANVQVLSNTLILQNRVPDGATYGILTYGATASNLTVSGNALSFDPSGNGYRQFYSITLSSIENATVQDNTADEASAGSNLAELVRGSVTGYAASILGNRTNTGEAMAGLGDATLQPLARALDFSTRGTVGTGENVLIQGFIVAGTAPANVLLRAIGPSIASDTIRAVADPVLALYDSAGALVATNDDWKSTQEAMIQSTGIPPGAAVESAILAELPPGSYTAVMSSKTGELGVGLVEIYDLGSGEAAVLQNVSTRGLVGIGSNILIGGLIVGAGQSPTVIARAIGPSLAAAGIQNPLSDPLLELHDSNGELLETNDSWRDPDALTAAAPGIAPVDDREAAIVRQLAPGNYTTIVRGVNNSTGIALVELYRLQ